MKAFSRAIAFLTCLTFVLEVAAKPAGFCADIFSGGLPLTLESLQTPPFWTVVESAQRAGELRAKLEELNHNPAALDEKLRLLLELPAESALEAGAPQRIEISESDAIVKAIGNHTAKAIEIRDKYKKGTNRDDANKVRILNTIRSIGEGRVIQAEDLENMELLHTLTQDLRVRAEKLRADLGQAGKVTLATADVLEKNRQEIEATLPKLKDKERIVFFLPVFNARTQQFSLELEDRGSLGSFKGLFDGQLHLKTNVEEIDRRLKRYVQDYVDLRYLTNRFTNIPDAMYSFPEPSRSHLAKPANPPDSLSPADHLRQIHSDLEKVFRASAPIHPSAKAVANYQRNSYFATQTRKAWLKVTGILIVTGLAAALLTQPKLFGDTYSKLVEGSLDSYNLHNHDYWIEKCSNQVGLKKIRECLDKFSDLVMAETRGKIMAKRKSDPKYQGSAELIDAQVEIQIVLNGVIPIDEDSPENWQVGMTIYQGQAIDYQIMGGYNRVKVRVHKTLAALKEADTKAKVQKTSPKALPGEPAAPVPSLSPSLPSFEKLFQQEKSTFDSKLKSAKNDPRQRSLSIAEYLMTLVGLREEIHQNKLDMDPEFQALLQQIEAETDAFSLAPLPPLPTAPVADPVGPPAPSAEPPTPQN